MQRGLANAPDIRVCSALRARADVFVALCLSSANTIVGEPGLRSMRESSAPILHSHPARLLAWLGISNSGIHVICAIHFHPLTIPVDGDMMA